MLIAVKLNKKLQLFSWREELFENPKREIKSDFTLEVWFVTFDKISNEILNRKRREAITTGIIWYFISQLLVLVIILMYVMFLFVLLVIYDFK